MFILIQGRIDERCGDTMVLDSVAGHRRTFEALAAFLSTQERAIELVAEAPCHLRPDWPTLRIFRMVKSDGKLTTKESPVGVLQVSGRPDLLARFIEFFSFEPGEDGAHRHPENLLRDELVQGSDSIIIEVDEYAHDPERWAADNADEAG